MMEDIGDGIALGEHHLPPRRKRPPFRWRPVYLDGNYIGWVALRRGGWSADDEHRLYPDEESCARALAARKREVHDAE